MRVTFVGHAALLIEARGVRILSDPWWQGPCFGSQWWIYPKPYLEALAGVSIDYIYISHGHSDHFHRGTLRRLPSAAKIIVSSTLDLAPALRDMGFEVTEIDPESPTELGQSVTCRIIPTHGGDSLIVLCDGKEVCVNANDSLHSASQATQDSVTSRLKQLYPQIDYLYCAYGIASHFPNCYVIPGKDNERTLINRQRYFNRQWVRIVELIQPRFAFPFAADVIFLDPDLFWANEPTRNSERPTTVFTSLHPAASTIVIDIAPGFSISEGRVERDIRFRPIRSNEIRRDFEGNSKHFSHTVNRSTDGLEFLKHALERSVAMCRSFLLEFPRNYRFMILVSDRTWALEVKKSDGVIAVNTLDPDKTKRGDYDVLLTSTFSYLRRSFTTYYGSETLFVGSGCRIEYTDRRRIKENLHRELITLVAKRDHAPKSRFGDQPRWLFQAKTLTKRLIGRVERDPYDLSAWTIFK